MSWIIYALNQREASEKKAIASRQTISLRFQLIPPTEIAHF